MAERAQPGHLADNEPLDLHNSFDPIGPGYLDREAPGFHRSPRRSASTGTHSVGSGTAALAAIALEADRQRRQQEQQDDERMDEDHLTDAPAT